MANKSCYCHRIASVQAAISTGDLGEDNRFPQRTPVALSLPARYVLTSPTLIISGIVNKLAILEKERIVKT